MGVSINRQNAGNVALSTVAALAVTVAALTTIGDLTSTSTTDVVAGDGSGGWQVSDVTSLVSVPDAGSLAGATFIDAPGETATAGELVIVSCNDEDGNITVDLPASPSAGDTVRLVNVSTEDYDVIAGRNGETINYSASDFSVGGPGMAAVYTYTGSTWLVGRFGSPPVMSQGEAEAGTSTASRLVTAERLSQAIAALGGGGSTEYLLTTIYSGGFSSGGWAQPSSSHKAFVHWDSGWRTECTTIELRTTGRGSSFSYTFKGPNGSTFWSPSANVVNDGQGSTIVNSLAGTSWPSTTEALELHISHDGGAYMNSVTLWCVP